MNPKTVLTICALILLGFGLGIVFQSIQPTPLPKVPTITNMDYDRVTVTVVGRQTTLSNVLSDLRMAKRETRMSDRAVWQWWKRFRHMCPEMMPKIATGAIYNWQRLEDESDRNRYNRCGEAMTINQE